MATAAAAHGAEVAELKATYRFAHAQTLDPKPETRNPKPETRNP